MNNVILKLISNLENEILWLGEDTHQSYIALNAAINALKNTLSNQKQHHVQIIYAGCQDKDHGTCGDMSLIMLQEVIEQASNKPTVSINNQIAVNIADTDQTNYENSIFHNIEYDNLQIEVVGDINYFH